MVKKETSSTTNTFPLDSVYYGNNTITANILPLAFDMVPESYKDDVEKLVDLIEKEEEFKFENYQ